MFNYLIAATLLVAPPLIEPPPLVDLSTSAVSLQPATRLDPPAVWPSEPTFSPDSSNGRCTGLEALLAWFSPGWDVVRMSRIAYRESRCQPGAYNRGGRAAGLLQVTPITYSYLSRSLGEPITVAKLFEPAFNVRAAAALFLAGHYSPWRTR